MQVYLKPLLKRKTFLLVQKRSYANPKFQVLNAMQYGNIPQNRERIYIVAFRNETDRLLFDFPMPIPLTTQLSDIIDFESKIDDKYYYTEGKYSGDIRHN